MFDKCWACPTGLEKDSPSMTSSCVARVYSNLSTSAKYALIGKTGDITYDMKSSTTLETLTVSPATTATCSRAGWPSLNYQYYGDLFNANTLTITHPGISDPNVRFWKVKIIPLT